MLYEAAEPRGTLEKERADASGRLREHGMNQRENKSEKKIYDRGTVRIPIPRSPTPEAMNTESADMRKDVP